MRRSDVDEDDDIRPHPESAGASGRGPAGEHVRSTERRHRESARAEALEELAAGRGWDCRQCGGRNVKARLTCYKCSRAREGTCEQDSSDDVVTEDEDAFRQFSRKPKKRGGRRHPGKGDRKKRSRKKVRRPGFSSRKGRNKKAHAEHGNQLNLVYWGTMLALIPLGYKGVVQIDNVVEDVMGSVSVNTVLLVDKMGSQGVALVETMGLFLRATLMSMFVVFMTWCGWTVSRKCRNKAMHRLHGNMLGEGQRTKKFMTRTGHVFVTEELVLGRNVMKCTCKAFIDLGTECQHIIVARQRWADQPLTGGVASTIGEDRAGGAGETLQAVPILDEVTSPGFSLRSRSAPSRSEYVEVGCLQGLVSKAKELGTGSRNKQPRVASAERDDARGQSSGLVRDDFSSPLATSEGCICNRCSTTFVRNRTPRDRCDLTTFPGLTRLCSIFPGEALWIALWRSRSSRPWIRFTLHTTRRSMTTRILPSSVTIWPCWAPRRIRSSSARSRMRSL